MSNQAYYGQQPQYPPQAYGHRPHGDGYYQQGPPQMQYAQMPLNQNNAPAPRRQKDRGCLMACLATLCCCFLCEEGCECCCECCECLTECC